MHFMAAQHHINVARHNQMMMMQMQANVFKPAMVTPMPAAVAPQPMAPMQNTPNVI
jgi:hypothetical protein